VSEIHQVLIYILIGVILGSFLFLFLSRLFRRRGPVVQGEPRSFSEKEVEEFLKRSGFEILGRKKYVVVVQSGLEASDPNEPMLRRKLLEFDHVFHPHALLVVDLSRGEIHEVNFRFPYERNIDFFFRFLIALFIIAMVIGIIWMLVQLRLI